MRDLDPILSYSTNLLTLHCVNSDGFGEDVCAFLRTSPTPGFLQNSFQDVFFILPFSLPEYALFTYARILDVRKPQSVLLISRSEDRQFVCFKCQTRALAFVCLYNLATGSGGGSGALNALGQARNPKPGSIQLCPGNLRPLPLPESDPFRKNDGF